MSEVLCFVGASILIWAWFSPHEVGQWVEKFRDPRRQKPIHQKKPN